MLLAITLSLSAIHDTRCGRYMMGDAGILFTRHAQSKDAAGVAALFDQKGEWAVDDRALVGPRQIATFFRTFARSGATIELLGNDATVWTGHGWTYSGSYIERRVDPLGKTNVTRGTYSLDTHCGARRWVIDRLETPRND